MELEGHMHFYWNCCTLYLLEDYKNWIRSGSEEEVKMDILVIDTEVHWE